METSAGGAVDRPVGASGPGSDGSTVGRRFEAPVHEDAPVDGGVDGPAGSFAVAVDGVLRSLRPGDVVTYGEVAAEAGRPGAARAVGRLLATSGGEYSWWRVVAASGRLAPGKEHDQGSRLVAEGVEVVDGRVVGMGSQVRPRRHRG